MLDHSQTHFQKLTKKKEKIPIMKICDSVVRNTGCICVMRGGNLMILAVLLKD